LIALRDSSLGFVIQCACEVESRSVVNSKLFEAHYIYTYIYIYIRIHPYHLPHPHLQSYTEEDESKAEGGEDDQTVLVLKKAPKYSKMPALWDEVQGTALKVIDDVTLPCPDEQDDAEDKVTPNPMQYTYGFEKGEDSCL